MTEATKLQRAEVLTAVDTFFDGVFAAIAAWEPELRDDITLRLDAGPLTGAQLVTLVEPGAHRVLDSTNLPLYGAGFCAADMLIGTGNPLAWWQGADRLLLASSTFGPGQAAIDLHRLEWYRVPAETGAGHVAGPFVDYLCSNEITLTAALPMHIAGSFAGVVCADVLVSSLEQELLPHLAALGSATLINVNGRVVLSTDGSTQTGDRAPGWPLAPGSEAETLQMLQSDRHPFALLITETNASV